MRRPSPTGSRCTSAYRHGGPPDAWLPGEPPIRVQRDSGAPFPTLGMSLNRSKIRRHSGDTAVLARLLHACLATRQSTPSERWEITNSG